MRLWPFSSATERFLAAETAPANEGAAGLVVPINASTANGVFSHGYAKIHDGEKFAGGLGDVSEIITDYWALRTKSAELFETNIYAKRIIRALVHAVIATGLFPEATPIESVIGIPEDSLDDWTDDVEARWGLYAADPEMCDYYGKHTDGEMQAIAFAESLLVGDVLKVTRFDDRGFPSTQLINGAAVCSPLLNDRENENEINHGVELDSFGREVAYWVILSDGTHERIPAKNELGETVARLIRVSDARLDGVRGMPILAVLLQMINDLDGYRHSALRKARIASMVAMFVTHDQPGVPGRALSAGSGAVLRDSLTVADSATNQQLNFAAMTPGVTIDRLGLGEKINFGPSTSTDEKFGEFEAAITAAMCSAVNIPPEIFRQSFSKAFNASQAANHEFQSYIEIVRKNFGGKYCKHSWRAWLINEALSRRVNAPGLLEAWRSKDHGDRYKLAAWLNSEWSGHVRPTTDIKKQMQGLELAASLGAIDFDTLARNFNGSRYRTNVKRQAKQRKLAAEAGVPLSSNAASAMAEEPDGEEPIGDDDDS